MRVKINNYQSIKEESFDIKGLTVITGPNNTGKSACFRALAGVFSNPKGHSHVRKGERYSSVLVTFDDGNTILWEKGKGVNRYEVNGRLIDKVGTSVPDEVVSLGLRAVSVDNREVWPQVARQFQQIFLIDLPPSVLSSALSDVEKIKKLEAASSLSRSDLRGATQKLKYKREDLDKERDYLSHFQGFEELVDRVEGAESSYNEAERLKTKITELEALKTQRDNMTSQIAVLEAAIDAVIPEHDFSPYEGIKSLLGMKRKRTTLLHAGRIIHEGVRHFFLPPEPKDNQAPELERIKSQRDKASSVLKEIKEHLDPIGELSTPPNYEQVDQMVTLRDKKNKIEAAMRVAADEIRNIQRELESILEMVGEDCPLCGRGEHHSH